MTDRTKTICNPIFDLRGIKIESFMFNVFKQSFIYTITNPHPSFNFDANNSPKLH